jgi:hypothetical protein
VRTPILYIGGAARSGSTLLESMLAGLPGCASVGEAVFIWERGVARDDRCACGDRFRQCEFWNEVGELAFGGWDSAPVRDGVRLRRAVDRHRNLHRLGFASLGRLEPDVLAYSELTEQLYRAVASVSRASVIVDSSKHASYALVLSRLSTFDLRLVHLVREPHGVAYSWSKKVRKRGVGEGTGFMSVHSTSWTVNRWVIDNLVFEGLRRRHPSTLLRYEDLVRAPVHELERVCRAVGLDALADAAGKLDPAAIAVPRSHAVSGNPDRPGEGVLRFREDHAWQRHMVPIRRAGVTAATWPLLLRYGYCRSAREARR